MNKYEILGIVGEGAYGIVYKAKNKETGAFGKWSNELDFSHRKFEIFLHFIDFVLRDLLIFQNLNSQNRN